MKMTFTIDPSLYEAVSGFSTFASDAQSIASLALYDGAGVIADGIRESINTNIATEPFRYATINNKRLPSPQELAALQKLSVGIARFRKNGAFVSTSIGFTTSGYVDVAGKSKAVALIANSIESGTSFMVKQPFFRKAVNKTKLQAVAAVNAKAQKIINDICKKYNL